MLGSHTGSIIPTIIMDIITIVLIIGIISQGIIAHSQDISQDITIPPETALIGIEETTADKS